MPVQALFGSRSPLQAVGVDRLRAAVPSWRVEVIPGAGHTLVMDAEDQVIERVLAFPRQPPLERGPDRTRAEVERAPTGRSGLELPKSACPGAWTPASS